MFDRRPAPVVDSPAPRLAIALALLSVALGCGDGKLACYPVSGSVTVGGKPFPGARVLLIPIEGSEKLQKERPFGVTDESGRFELTTFAKGDGAPAGDYKVLIRASAPRDAEQAKQWSKRPKLNPKYRKPDTTDLNVTVDQAPTELPPFAL